MFWLLAVMKMLIDFAICMLFVSGVQTIELKTSGNVTIVKGGSVTLRCDSSDKGANIATMNHLHMRNLSIYLSVSIVGAAVVIMIVALVIWKMKRKPPASELDRKPHKNMPLYENVHNVPNTECHRNSDTSTSIYENVDNK
ncbi:uncharacterized protein [Heterodontus francisci]|uniref:uncharacterized protein isoform X2 n=1 Tax=Heterodontus francisci TaxID=7792 RepID=UPI00355B4AD2